MLIPGLNYLQLGAGAAAAFALSYLLHTVDIDIREARHNTELADQQKALNESCEKDKQITKEANDALQNQINVIAGKLAATKRLRPVCVQVATGKADVADIRGEHAGQGRSGLSSDWLHEYFATCEEIRQSFLSCDKFTDDERK